MIQMKLLEGCDWSYKKTDFSHLILGCDARNVVSHLIFGCDAT